MRGSYYLLLLFPIGIFVAGFLVLDESLYPTAERLSHQLTIDSPVTQTKRVKHEEKAMPYFILASVFVIVILVLPRLQELSISQQSLVIKLFEEVKEAADDLDEESSPLGSEALRTGISREKIRLLKDRIRTVDKVLTKGK